MDAYLKALIQTHVHIDSGGRCFFKGQEVETHVIGGIRKVLLPGSKVMWTFDDLKRVGAKVDVITLFSLAKAGGEGRWRDEIQDRRERGIPSNVYVANARTINKALAENRVPPQATWIGRIGRRMTEVRDTIDEVLDDMAKDKWRTDFSRGRNARKS